jgi:hypothetical protein
LPQFLAEISTEKAKAARGMTALVVRKNGEQRPGSGFFELAQRVGYDVSDPEKFWDRRSKQSVRQLAKG